MKVEVVVSVEMTPGQVAEYARAYTGGDVSAVGSDVVDWVAEAVEVSRLQASGLVSVDVRQVGGE